MDREITTLAHWLRRAATWLLDICEPIPGLHDTATESDLDQTLKEVEAAGTRGLALKADVRDHGAVEAAVARALDTLGRIDILVNNAGMASLDTLHDMSPETLDAIIDTNLKGPMIVAQYVGRR